MSKMHFWKRFFNWPIFSLICWEMLENGLNAVENWSLFWWKLDCGWTVNNRKEFLHLRLFLVQFSASLLTVKGNFSQNSMQSIFHKSSYFSHLFPILPPKVINSQMHELLEVVFSLHFYGSLILIYWKCKNFAWPHQELSWSYKWWWLSGILGSKLKQYSCRLASLIFCESLYCKHIRYYQSEVGRPSFF